ncbi:MAG: DNA primase, partial [Halothiobacillaceae bacterium]
ALATTPAQQKWLMEAGLIVSREEKTAHFYDRFRNRIIFPIRDTRGRVIGFGGRVIDNSDTPKYLNSPESALFHKGRELYGLYEAKKALRHCERLLVVEGYMDVVMLAQHGIHYAVATLGTAATPQHVEKLFRSTTEVIFCFDGDNAGRTAAWRAMQHTLPAMREGRQARFMFLPDGEDPDSLVQKLGASAFERLLEEALPLSTFLFNHLSEQTDISNLDGRARLVELAKPLLATVPEGIFKHMLHQELAQRARVDPRSVTAVRLTPSRRARPPTQRSTLPGGGRSPVATAIALLLHKPALAAEVPPQPTWLQSNGSPGVAILLELIETLHQRPHLTTGALLEFWRENDAYASLLKLSQRTILSPEEGLKMEFLGALKLIAQQGIEKRVEVLLNTPFSELTPEERAELSTALATGKSMRKE